MTEPIQHDASDTLAFGDPGEDRARGRRGVKGTLVATAVAATVAGLALGGLAVAQFLSGGGPQPEEALPRTTVAFVKVDLDPSAGQKVNALRLAKKFPRVSDGPDDLKQALLEDAFDENEYGLTYREDLAPWIGDRAAVGAVSTPGTEDKVAPVVAVEFTDREAMVRMLEEARTRITEDGPTSDRFAYAVREPYVLISQKQAEVDAMAAEPALASDPGAAAVFDAAGVDDLIAFAWADFGALGDLVPDEAMFSTFGTAEPQGQFTLGVRAEPDHVEATGTFTGLDAGMMPAATPVGTELLAAMPHDAFVAGAISGVGDQIAQQYQSFKDASGEDARHLRVWERQMANELGIEIPEDLSLLFGSEAAFAVTNPDSDTFRGALRVRTEQGERAVELLRPLLAMTGEPDLAMSGTPDGYVVASHELLDPVRTGTGGLTSTESFQRAVPRADEASHAFYVDLATIIDNAAPKKTARELAPLDAIGLSASADGERAEFTLRLTLR